MIVAKDIAVVRGPRRLLDRVDFAAFPGEIVGIVGANGAGKSTLVRVLAGEMAPEAGDVAFDGTPLRDVRPETLARRRAVLPQHATLAFELPAIEVAALGRLAHPAGGDPRAIAAEALDACGAGHLAARAYSTLSGGEQQRVQLARVLAQLDARDGPDGPRLLLLDEPTASLDIAHQQSVLRLARRMACAGHAVVAVLHDLNLAARYCDRIALMAGGRVLADAPPALALANDLLFRTFGVAMRTLRLPEGGIFIAPEAEPA
ncbi:MAG: heme ABC transporter ATP-binding protein [Rhodospirillales bacterium]|nr:heme ABC transporter ATP-binding protein [Rhodospirillales bacterium]